MNEKVAKNFVFWHSQVLSRKKHTLDLFIIFLKIICFQRIADFEAMNEKDKTLQRKLTKNIRNKFQLVVLFTWLVN